MKLYAVVVDVPYEGYNAPNSIWTKKSKALAHARALRKKGGSRYDVVIFEYEPDEDKPEVELYTFPTLVWATGRGDK